MTLHLLDAFLLATAFSVAGRSGAALVECRLQTAPTHRAGSPVNVTFVLKNVSGRAVSVLEWQTPLEGLFGDVFRIVPKGGGEPLGYQGPMVKRRAPSKDDYVRLAPRRELSGSVDAAAAYDLSRPGSYTLSFPGPLLDLIGPPGRPRPGGEMRPFPVSCGPVEFAIVP